MKTRHLVGSVDEKQILTLARRVSGSLRGKYPAGITQADCVQDCVVLIMQLQGQHVSHGGTRGSSVAFETWLFTRVRGDLLDQYGRVWRESYRIREVCPVDSTHPYNVAPDEGVEERIDVEAALRALPAEQQQIARLTMAGQTQTQIADSLGMSQAYVSKVLRTAKVALAESLKAYGEN